MDEEWREIAGHSLYVINREGVVWSQQWNRALRQSNQTHPRVTLLSDENKRKSFKVEDLLAQAFGDN